MYASGDFGIRKNKIVRNEEIIPNKVDNTRDYIISFSNTGSSTPTYSIYTFDNTRVGEFALNSSNFHSTNDYLTQLEGSNDLYLEDEGSLITLVRVFHELTPFTGSTNTYYNAFVKVDFDFENVSTSTYSIIGYYGTTGSAATSVPTEANFFLHHYDEPNNDMYMSTGGPNETAFFRQIDIASYSQVVSKSLTASGYAYFLDYDEMTNSSEIRLIDSSTSDKDLRNFKYEWDTDTITESATAGNYGAVFKRSYGYVEVDMSNSSTVSLILQDFDCNDLDILAQQDSLITTPAKIESSNITGGKLYSDSLEFLAIDSATANTGLYNFFQKNTDNFIASNNDKLEIIYSTASKVNDGDVLIDGDRGFIYTFNSGLGTSNDGGTISIRQHDLDFNFISEFNPTSSITWGTQFVSHNWVEETKTKMMLPLNSNSSDRVYILDINFEDFSQSEFTINATASSFVDVVTPHYYDQDNNIIYYSEGQFNGGDNLIFKKLNLITALYSVNYNTNLTRHMGSTLFDPLREEVFGVVNVTLSAGRYASFSYTSLTYSETSSDFPSRRTDIIDINDNIITIAARDNTDNSIIFYDEITNDDSLTVVSSIQVDVIESLISVSSLTGDRNNIYAFDNDNIIKIRKNNADDRKAINSNCAYLEEIISATFTGVTGGVFIGASTESEYFYVTNTNNNSGDDLTIYQYDFDFNLVDSWDTTYTTTRYTNNFIWDEDEKTFWVVASESSFSLLKFKINETTLSSSTVEEDINYVFPSGYSSLNTRNAFLRETDDDIIFSLSGTDNGINNVYYVDKVGATTSKTVDLSSIADSFFIFEATYIEDRNISFINTVGFGISGTPRVNFTYNWDDDSTNILSIDSDAIAYYLTDYLTTRLQEVLYVDSGDILHLEVRNFIDEVTYSDIPSTITLASKTGLTKLRDGRISHISPIDGEGTLFRIQNSILESDDCNPIQDQDIGRPLILEMQTNGSNQVTINTSIIAGQGEQIVRWGDGTSDSYLSTGNKTHTYDTAGIYDISIYGNLSRIDMLGTGSETDLLAIKQWGDSRISMRFQNCSNLEGKYTDSPNVEGSLQNAFGNCTKFNGKVNDWDLSNVINTAGMFGNCINFNQPVNNWNTTGIINMSTMFFNCPKFNQPLDNWDVSNVTSFTNFLSGCVNFNQPLGNWDMTSVVTANTMFNNCESFNQPLNTWDVSNIESFRGMFRDCDIFDQPLDKWETTSATDIGDMFIRGIFNQPIDTWDVSNVENAALMFFLNQEFNQPLNSWTVSNISNMGYMFYGATKFNQDLDNWDTSSLSLTSNMFSGASDFNGKIYNWDMSGVGNMTSMLRNTSFSGTVSGWDVSNVTNMSTVFFRCFDFSDNINSWTVSNVQNMANLFYECSSFDQPLDNWDVSSVTDFRTMFRVTPFNQDIGNWDTSSAVLMSQMFVGATQFNQDISSWTVSKVTTFNAMFNGCFSFNQPLDTWDVSQVTDMNTMFFNSAMNQDLNSWDTGSVSTMVNMFSSSDFNGTVSNWDVSNVTNMQSMFSGAPFDKDIGNWDVSNVENMQAMFSGTPFNQDISGWTVSNVTNMRQMFNANNEFDQDISGWDIDQVTNFFNFRFTVTGGSFSVANYDAILIAWEAQAPQTGIDISFGASKYTGGGAAEAARDSLVATYSWTIDDNGTI